MWVSYRKIRKLWVLYMFVMFFGIFMLFYCTKILLEHPANVLMKQHKLRLGFFVSFFFWFPVEQKISIFRLNERIKNLKSRNNPNVVVGHYIGQGNLFGNVSKGLFPYTIRGDLVKKISSLLLSTLIFRWFWFSSNFILPNFFYLLKKKFN